MSVIELRHDGARARISTAGAEWLSWSLGDRNLLWTPDPAFWEGTAPILFPVCGWTRNGEARVGQQTYPLSLHGFARHCEFDVVEMGEGHVQLRLVDQQSTRALYPFAFELKVLYRLSSLGIEITGEVRNTGKGPMPYAFGLHPGFARDPEAQARVVFDVAERPDVPVIAPGGLFSEERRGIALTDRVLDLRPDTFAQEALCFVPARSRGLEFEAGGHRLRADFRDFANLVLWSRPGAPFLCIEPWTGFGDPVGFSGDLFDKPGMSILGAGEGATHKAVFAVTS